MNLTNNHMSIGRYAQACAARADLKVQFKPEEAPHSDGRTIYLPSITSHTTDKQITHLLHYVSHEVGHVLYTDFDFGKKVGVDASNSFLGFIWNCLEDVRIEYLNACDYEGDRLNSDRFYQDFIPEVYTKLKKRLDSAEGKDIAGAAAMLCWTQQQEVEFHISLSFIDNSISKHSLVSPYYNKLMEGNYSEVLKNIRENRSLVGTQETYELAKRIYEEVFDGDAEQEEKRVQQAQQKGKGEDKSGGQQEGEGENQEAEQGESEGQEGESDNPSDGKSSKSGSKQAEKDESDKDGKGKSKPSSVKITDYTQFIESSNNGKGDLHIDYSNYKGTYGEYTPSSATSTVIKDFTKEDYSSEINKADFQSILERIKATESGNSKSLANKLRTKLQIMSKAKHQYGVKRGKLHNANLYRVTMKDAKGYNERVFKTRIDSDVLDTCVCVLVDTSGSMSGSKYSYAARSALLLNEAIGNVLGIPLSIMGFTTQQVARKEEAKMLIYRRFANRRVDNSIVEASIAKGGSMGMANNVDGEALVYAYDELLRQPQQRKVLLVLSDGSPAGGHSKGDVYTYTEEIVKAIEASKKVDIYGIGIQDSNVKHFYKKHVVVNSISNLESTLLSVLDKSITN